MIHWVADFILQSDEDAKGKSTNNGHLLSHTATYTFVWIAPALWYTLHNNIDSMLAVYFLGITFVLHTVTDYVTSRINSKLWKKGDSHNFFVSVGFDQILHYMQLFITFKLLLG